MTVAELIAELKNLPPDVELVAYNKTTFIAATIKEVKYIERTRMGSIEVSEK